MAPILTLSLILTLTLTLSLTLSLTFTLTLIGGVIGVAKHTKGTGWVLLPSAGVVSVETPMETRSGIERIFNMTAYWEMERPWVVKREGQYHMFFHCWPGMVHPRFSSLYWGEKVRVGVRVRFRI